MLMFKKEATPQSIILFFFSILLFSFLFYKTLIPLQITPSFFFPTKTSNNCNYSYGKWVWDESEARKRYTEQCPFLDPGFRCQRSGRLDLDYQKWRWQPQFCHLPRFDAHDFLERGRNRRIVFAGDSIGRNQWESFICMLAQGISNLSTIYEEFGRPITKHDGFFSLKFREYNLTVQYYRLPYLVKIDRPPKNSSKEIWGVIRVDTLHWYSNKWVGADVLVINTGHWWNEEKTLKSGFYFEEGDHVNKSMDAMEALKRSLNTLKLWVTKNFDIEKSFIFLRSYSPTHYRDGEWDKGGYCNTSKEPETDSTKLEPEPLKNAIMYEVVKELQASRVKAHWLNITYLTELRRDGHPSSHREPGTRPDAPQDCSHWCLPGVPDTWNELLYAELLSMGFR